MVGRFAGKVGESFLNIFDNMPNQALTKWGRLKQSPDLYGILASRMVGRFEEKVGKFRSNPHIMSENSYKMWKLTSFYWKTRNRALY